MPGAVAKLAAAAVAHEIDGAGTVAGGTWPCVSYTVEQALARLPGELKPVKTFRHDADKPAGKSSQHGEYPKQGRVLRLLDLHQDLKL